MKKILVTGAAGFIGFHFSKMLLEKGYDVYGIDNMNDYYDVRLKEARLEQLTPSNHFHFERLDLADRAGMEVYFAKIKPEIVVNLAAQAGVRYSIDNPHAYVDSNVQGFLNVLEGCRHNGVAHLIYASSSSVYGANDKLPFSVNDNVDHPISLYAATKKSNELMAHTYAHLYGFPVTGLRFFTVYGPWGRPDMAYFKFTKAIEKGEAIDVYNHGDMKRDFTYIDDITEAILRLVEQEPRANKEPQFDTADSGDARNVTGNKNNDTYRLYNIGNNSPEDLMFFINALEAELGKKADLNMLPMQPGDVYATYADTEALANDIGFKPSTPLTEGIAKFVKWYKNYYHS